jgi:hypothetical protein
MWPAVSVTAIKVRFIKSEVNEWHRQPAVTCGGFRFSQPEFCDDNRNKLGLQLNLQA